MPCGVPGGTKPLVEDFFDSPGITCDDSFLGWSVGLTRAPLGQKRVGVRGGRKQQSEERTKRNRITSETTSERRGGHHRRGRRGERDRWGRGVEEQERERERRIIRVVCACVPLKAHPQRTHLCCFPFLFSSLWFQGSRVVCIMCAACRCVCTRVRGKAAALVHRLSRASAIL